MLWLGVEYIYLQVYCLRYQAAESGLDVGAVVVVSRVRTVGPVPIVLTRQSLVALAGRSSAAQRGSVCSSYDPISPCHSPVPHGKNTGNNAAIFAYRCRSHQNLEGVLRYSFSSKILRYIFRSGKMPTSKRYVFTQLTLASVLQGIQDGTLQTPPGVDTPAVPIPVLQHMKETNTWPVNLQL